MHYIININITQQITDILFGSLLVKTGQLVHIGQSNSLLGIKNIV